MRIYVKGQYDKAIEDYNKAILLKPDLAEAYFNRGVAYQSKGQKNMAIADYKKSCGLGHNNGCEQVKKMEAGR